MSEDAIAYKVATGPVRDSSIWVSWQTLKALRMIGKASEIPPDALANDVLRAWLLEKHPTVVQHIEAQQQAADDFQKGLKEQLRVKLTMI